MSTFTIQQNQNQARLSIRLSVLSLLSLFLLSKCHCAQAIVRLPFHKIRTKSSSKSTSSGYNITNNNCHRNKSLLAFQSKHPTGGTAAGSTGSTGSTGGSSNHSQYQKNNIYTVTCTRTKSKPVLFTTHNMNSNQSNYNYQSNYKNKINNDNDAKAYNHYISQTVDISSNDVYENKQNGIVTFLRSCRDLDLNTKKKYMYSYNHVEFMDKHYCYHSNHSDHSDHGDDHNNHDNEMIYCNSINDDNISSSSSHVSNNYNDNNHNLSHDRDTSINGGKRFSDNNNDNDVITVTQNKDNQNQYINEEDMNNDNFIYNSSNMNNIKNNMSQNNSNNNSNHNNNDNYNNPMIMTPPMEVQSNIKARIISPSGKKIAVFIVENNNNNQQQKHIVEIWTNQGMKLSKRILLPTTTAAAAAATSTQLLQHGNVCFDFSWFGSISWNNDESALVYSAEMKHPKTISYFHNGGSTDDDESLVGLTNTLGYGKGEDWGEKYTSTCRLNLYILNVHTGKVGLVKNVPRGIGERNQAKGTNKKNHQSTNGGYTFGQAIFSPCGNHIVYTGWDAGAGGAAPRRLGSIYCYQRPSKIYSSSVRQLLLTLATSSSDKEDRGEAYHDQVMDAEVVEDFTCLTPRDHLARSPRFNTSASANNKNNGIYTLVYLCNTKGFDTHGGAMALHAVDWYNHSGVNFETKRVLVDVVALPHFKNANVPDDESTVLGMSFPGLFLNQLPREPFTPDGKYLITSIQWGSITKIVKISMDDGEVKAINFNLLRKDSAFLNDVSQSLLCITSKGDAIVNQSHPSLPAVLGIIPSSYLTDDRCKVKPSLLLPTFDSITASTKYDCYSPKFNAGSTCHLVSITPNHGDLKSIVQGILTVPNDNNGEPLKNVPLLVVPHGGPHSCFDVSYSPSYAYLCEHGRYALLQVNYRGSTGFGQASLESLAGNVGRQDIDDIVQLTNRVTSAFKCIDSSRVGICGGSHGGFLAAHAIGQYPEVFRVACLRNPVTNIATMVTSTDIPDWCYVETLGTGKYDWSQFKGPNADELSLMWKASPIAHIAKVQAPTLIAIGKSDKRVPPSQGMEYFYALRSKGVKTKLLLYDDDDHAIDHVQSEADHWINIKQWFDENI